MKKAKRLISFIISMALILSETSGLSFPTYAEGKSVSTLSTEATPADASSTDSEESEKGLSTNVDGIEVSVNDVNSVLPEGTYIEVTKLDDNDALKMAKEAAGKTEDGTELVRDAVGVDINFYDSFGNQFEPSDDVEVSIDIKDYRSLDIEDKFTNPSYDVLHIPEEGEPEFIENKASDEEGVVFESDEFSPYILTASPINLYRAKQPSIDSGFSDYTPYITTHVLSVDGKEILTGDTIEPTTGFKLELSFNLKLSDMSKNITDSTDGLHYYFVLPEHISIGNKGDSDNQIPLYNSRNVQIGQYFIKSSTDGDVMYVTFPGFYDDVTTYFDLSASWSDTEDRDAIDVAWSDRTDKYFINRTSLIITKEQTHARRDEDGITRNRFTVSIKAKDDLNDVKNVSFKDEMTSQHMVVDPSAIDDGNGNKYAYKITSYAADGTIVGDPTYLSASEAVTTDAGEKGKLTTLELSGLTVPKGGKVVVEYTTYIPREVKRLMDANGEDDSLENKASASHPVTNQTTQEVENPWITSEVTDKVIYKKEWLLKDAKNDDLVKITDVDNTEYIAMDYDVEINTLREYTMAGALIRDVISNSFYDTTNIKYTNVTYDTKNLANEAPKVTITVKANTVTEKQLTWITLDSSTYNNFLTKINVKDPLNALERLKSDASLADVRTSLQNAITAARSSFSGDYSDYLFTDADCHEFIWLTPEDPKDPVTGERNVATFKLHYHTLSGLGVSSFSNSASLRYQEMDPVIFGAIGYPGDYNLKKRQIDINKYNEGVYLGEDGNFYIDWTINASVPANSRGWEDVMLIDDLPTYVVGDGDNKIVYSDWLKGLAGPDVDSINSGVFKFSTESDRDDVKAIVNRAKAGLNNGYWNGYSETETSTYHNGIFYERPDSEWIDYLSKWGSDAFNATIVARGTYYHGKDLAAGQFVVETDGTDWVSKVKKGDTGTISTYSIYLGDFPGTESEGYTVQIKYTTQVNPLLVKRLPDILQSTGQEVVTLTNTAKAYHSYVKRDSEGNILGRALMQGGSAEGYLGELQSSYWLGSGDAKDCIVKDMTSEYNKTTGTVGYKSYLNKHKQLSASKNVYTIQDAMNVPGVLYTNINLKFPQGVQSGATIIQNGKVVDAYKNYVKIEATSSDTHSNKLTITFDNRDEMFQDAQGMLAQLELTYDADFSKNSVSTDVTLSNSVVLSERIPTANANEFTTKLIDQAEVEYTIDKALDKYLDKDNLPSESNNFTANYYILVNPESTNAKELAALPVGDTFTVRDTMGSNMDLILRSVKVSQIEGGVSTDITSSCQSSYNAQNKILDVKLAKKSDTATYKIEYKVNVTHLAKDGETYLRNKAEILGTTVKKDELNDRVSILNSHESSDASNYMIRIQKYDMDDITKKVNASFDIYKYDNGWKCLTTGADKIYSSDYPIETTNGKVVITNKIPDNKPHQLIEKDTWYKLVERSTDPGYSVNNEPLYYYVSQDGQTHSNPPYGVTNYSIATLLTGKSENEIEEDTLPTLLFGNRKLGFSVEKTDKGTGDIIPGVEFTIYSDEQCTTEIGKETTDTNGIADFVDITVLDAAGDGAIYLKETATVQNYIQNTNTYKVTFEAGQVTSAVNIDDASDKMAVDSKGILSKVHFTNISDSNKLVIAKTVESKSDIYKNVDFEFFINLTDADGKTLTGSYEYRKFYADGTADVLPLTIVSGGSVKLKSGERIEIYNLPTGTKYRVSESAEKDYNVSLTVTDNVGLDRKVGYSSWTTGTVEQGSADVVTFLNRRKTSLIVTKEALLKDGTALNIPDGFTVTLRTDNNHTGRVWATAHYDAATGKFVSDSLADEGMQFFTTFEDGTDIVGGFRITGIDTLKDIAVVESNADIAGYAYKLTDANEYNANSKWSGADSDNRTVALKNVYYTSYAEVNMTANKTLIGRKLEAGEFDFALYTVQGDSYSKQIKTGIKNDATGKVDFGRITYSLDDLGTETAVDKYYKIVENKGTNPGVSYDDKTAVYVKVHLHKEVDATSGEERIVADEPVYSSTDMRGGLAGDGVKPDFVNYYDADGHLELGISKTMLGKDVSAGQFEFNLTEYTDDTFTTVRPDMPAPLSTCRSTQLSAGASSEMKFSALDYAIVTDHNSGSVIIDEVRNHYYIIEEVIPTDAETKTLLDGTTVKMKDNIIYDDTRFKLVVIATDDKQGKVIPKVYKINDDGKTEVVSEANFASTFSFTNKYYAEGTVDISLTKTLTGRDTKRGEFGFTIAEYTDASYSTRKQDSAGKDIEYSARSAAASNAVPQVIPFGSIRYDIDDVGTHYYKMSENQPSGAVVSTSDGKLKKDGVTYDNTEYDFRVEVTDAGNGSLKTDIVDDNGKDITSAPSYFEFNNTYAAAGEITLRGNKTLNGKDTTNSRDMKDDEFKYSVVEYTDDTYNTKLGSAIYTGSSKADGTIAFDTISYKVDSKSSDVGKHYYKITEDIPTGAVDNGDGSYTYKGVTYPEQSCKVVVEVTDNEDGTLKAALSGEGTDASFINLYAASGSTDISLTKQTVGAKGNVYNGLEAKQKNGDYKFEFELSEVTSGANGEKTETVIEKVISGLNEKISFSKLNYNLDDLGEHTYRVKEVTGKVPGITYDNTVYEIKVTVSDNQDGTLSIDKLLTDAEEIKFTNLYNAFGEVTFKGTKTVSNLDKNISGLALKDGMFSFTVKEAGSDGNVAADSKDVATGKNNKEGGIDFTSIKYDLSDVGTHTYIISESSANPVSGLIYDASPVKATVEVTDNGDGTLAANVKYEKKGVAADIASFINDSSELKVKKTNRDGAGLAGAEFNITTKDGKVVTSFTSNGNLNQIYGLALETDYILVETKAPEGYQTAANVNFRLDKNGQLYVEGAKADQITVVDDKASMDTSRHIPTGDAMNMILILMLMFASFAGVLFILKKKRDSKCS